MFERITTEAMKIMQRDGKATLSTQAIHTACVVNSFVVPTTNNLSAKATGS